MATTCIQLVVEGLRLLLKWYANQCVYSIDSISCDEQFVLFAACVRMLALVSNVDGINMSAILSRNNYPVYCIPHRKSYASMSMVHAYNSGNSNYYNNINTASNNNDNNYVDIVRSLNLGQSRVDM